MMSTMICLTPGCDRPVTRKTFFVGGREVWVHTDSGQPECYVGTCNTSQCDRHPTGTDPHREQPDHCIEWQGKVAAQLLPQGEPE